MNITDQICSFIFAKRLKKLGVKQDSLFYRFDHGDFQYIFCKEYEQYSQHVNLNIEDGFSAFTVGELGEILPGIINRGDIRFNLQFYKLQGNAQGTYYWEGQYYDGNTDIVLHSAFNHFFIADESEVNCRAKMLIYLLENKLMELPK